VACPECSNLVSLLSDYIDGRLSTNVCAQLERHLAGCSDCTAFVDSFKSTVALLHSLTEDDLPPALRLRLKAFLDEQSKC
jgi:anti-sigma factor RsiW